jgi:hypothetical protein
MTSGALVRPPEAAPGSTAPPGGRALRWGCPQGAQSQPHSHALTAMEKSGLKT